MIVSGDVTQVDLPRGAQQRAGRRRAAVRRNRGRRDRAALDVRHRAPSARCETRARRISAPETRNPFRSTMPTIRAARGCVRRRCGRPRPPARRSRRRRCDRVAQHGSRSGDARNQPRASAQRPVDRRAQLSALRSGRVRPQRPHAATQPDGRRTDAGRHRDLGRRRARASRRVRRAARTRGGTPVDPRSCCTCAVTTTSRPAIGG